jgi:glycosyltransferase involved in cell wall biosynthesis
MTASLSDAGRWPRTASRARRAASALKDTALGYWRWLEAEVDSSRGSRSLTQPTARHVLIVATSLPPRFDGGVFRPLSWLKYGAENGWRVSAVTRAMTEGPTEPGLQLAAAIPDSSVVRHTTPFALTPSYRLFAQVDGGLLTALELYLAGAESFRGERPAVVVGTGPRFAAFVAAFFLARRFGAKLVLDYRDEWTENPFSFVQLGAADRWWERRCLAAADFVLFTTKSQLRHNDAAFPGLIGGKGFVLSNGWEPDPSIAAPDPAASHGDRLDIAFSGVLGTMGSPAAFLGDCAQVLAENSDVRDKLCLRFIGRRLPAADRELRQFGYPELLELIDQRPRREADALIRQSDALLILSSADMARYMPGKMFEYMATGKPILVHGHPGDVQELVTRLGAGLYVAEGDADALANAFATLAETPASVWNSPRRQSWAQQHTRQRLAQRFFDLLSNLTTPGNMDGMRT